MPKAKGKKSRLFKSLSILGVVFLLMGFAKAPKKQEQPYVPLSTDKEPFAASITVNAAHSFPSNKLLLGNNVQWVDRGDELLLRNSTEYNPKTLKKARELKPTVLRYPGGSLADLYRWEGGIGELAKRKRSSRFHGKGDDKIAFGTREFLELCKLVGAEPMFTANVITAPPGETVKWLQKVNVQGMKGRSGESLPSVKYWEIGNEPYLIDDNQKHLAVTPKEFAKKANAVVPRLRKIDPAIKIGLPLRSDDFDGMPATPLPGFNDVVLREFKEKLDFVAVHNTYFPFLWNDVPKAEEQIYLATMAATEVVRKDLDRTRQQLKTLRKEENIPIAITEMNSMFSLGMGKTDSYIRSLSSAIYIADLLSMLAQRSDILMANYWSLTGNWEFGAISQKGDAQASFHVLHKFHDMLDGQHLKTTVKSPSFDIVTTGFVNAQEGIPFLSALATKTQKNKLLLWVINKHPKQKANISLDLGKQPTPPSVSVETLTTEDYFSVEQAEAMRWKASTSSVKKGSKALTLEPHSINLITLVL